jgi:hypothetical protein
VVNTPAGALAEQVAKHMKLVGVPNALKRPIEDFDDTRETA